MVSTILPIGYHIVPSKPHFRILCLIQPTATILKPNPFFSWYQQSHQSVTISSPQNLTFVFSLLSNQQPPLKTQILPSDGTNNPTNRLPYCRLKTSLSHSVLSNQQPPLKNQILSCYGTCPTILPIGYHNLRSNRHLPSLKSYQQQLLSLSISLTLILPAALFTVFSSQIFTYHVLLADLANCHHFKLDEYFNGISCLRTKVKNNVIGLSLGVALIPYRTQQNLARLFYT